MDRPPLIYHFTPNQSAVNAVDARSAYSNYRRTLGPERRILVDRYELCDIAFKAVGVGSVGTLCAVGLFTTPDLEPLILQIKEAGTSVLQSIVPKADRQRNQGRRVVEGQRVMQAASDLFLAWTEDDTSKRHFYVRRLKNQRLGSINRVVVGNALPAYADLCANPGACARAIRRLCNADWVYGDIR